MVYKNEEGREDTCLIELDPPIRWAQMGKLKVMLEQDSK